MEEWQRQQLEAEATKLLGQAGYLADGRRPEELLPKGERSILIPNGGFSGRSTRKLPRTIRVYFSD